MNFGSDHLPYDTKSGGWGGGGGDAVGFWPDTKGGGGGGGGGGGTRILNVLEGGAEKIEDLATTPILVFILETETEGGARAP